MTNSSQNVIRAQADVLVGKPCIHGTRISVDFLIERLLDGWSVSQLIDSYPVLRVEDVEAAIAFAEQQK